MPNRFCTTYFSSSVNCGGHSATNCNGCPVNGNNFMGSSWCNGDCHWIDDKCIPTTSTTPAPTTTTPAPTTTTPAPTGNFPS